MPILNWVKRFLSTLHHVAEWLEANRVNFIDPFQIQTDSTSGRLNYMYFFSTFGQLFSKQGIYADWEIYTQLRIINNTKACKP